MVLRLASKRYQVAVRYNLMIRKSWRSPTRPEGCQFIRGSRRSCAIQRCRMPPSDGAQAVVIRSRQIPARRPPIRAQRWCGACAAEPWRKGIKIVNEEGPDSTCIQQADPHETRTKGREVLCWYC